MGVWIFLNLGAQIINQHNFCKKSNDGIISGWSPLLPFPTIALLIKKSRGRRKRCCKTLLNGDYVKYAPEKRTVSICDAWRVTRKGVQPEPPFFSASMQWRWPVGVICLHHRAKQNSCLKGETSYASGILSWSSFPWKVIKYMHFLIRDKCQSVHDDGRLRFPWCWYIMAGAHESLMAGLYLGAFSFWGR